MCVKRLALLAMALLVLTGCQRSAPPVAQEAVTVPEMPAAYQPTEQHKQALALVDKADYKGAEALLEQVVADQPKAAEAWNDLSFVQAQQSHWPDAAASARKALAANPYFAYAEYNLGWALLHTNDWKTAKAYLEASADLQPDRPEPLYAVGEWYRMSGAAAEAAERYRKAAAMGYKPALDQLAVIEANQAKQQGAQAAIAAFPNVPAKVLRDIYATYVPEGVQRRVDQVVSLVPKTGGERLWAALIFDQGAKSTPTQLVAFHAEVSQVWTYRGSCSLSPVELPKDKVSMQVLSVQGGQHLLVTMPGGAVICGVKDNTATQLFRSDKPVVAGNGGISVGGEPYRFVPETSQYLPAARADQLGALLAESRQAGFKLDDDMGVWADVNPGGQSGIALAWTEGVAFKPEGKPALFYPLNHVLVPYPTRVGMVTVPGHAFLAVETHQIGGPNGADALVLEYDPAAGTLRSVAHVSGDGARFDKDSISSAFKAYRPEGGFDAYETKYKWDEAAHTFVKGETFKAGK